MTISGLVGSDFDGLLERYIGKTEQGLRAALGEPEKIENKDGRKEFAYPIFDKDRRIVAHHFYTFSEDGLVIGARHDFLDVACEFDTGYYRSVHRDLAKHSDKALLEHYQVHGRSEGRECSPMQRREGFLNGIRNGRPALEIGPFDSPVLLGEGVFYLDVHDRPHLMGRARRIPGRNPEAIPNIHYVGQLSAVREKFRLVLSCHSIEHQPDLIGHLRDVEAVLEAGGAYAVIVPDKRYCFDRFLPESTVAEPLAALHEGRTKHTLQKIIEHYALTTHNDPVRHWQGDHGSERTEQKGVAAAIAEWQTGKYVDVHAWQFTPASFRRLMADVKLLGLIGLETERVYETPFGCGEFCAILRKY